MSRQAGTDVFVNFDRPSLVQTLSLTAALVTQFLNACCSAGETMPLRQSTSSVRPEEVSSPLAPVFWMHAVASALALAIADDEAMGALDVAPVLGSLLLLLLELLQPAAVMSASAAAAVKT